MTFYIDLLLIYYRLTQMKLYQHNLSTSARRFRKDAVWFNSIWLDALSIRFIGALL